MKVYRIYSKANKRFKTSNKNQEGYYTKLNSAKRALAQWKNRVYYKQYNWVIMEYELTNEKELE